MHLTCRERVLDLTAPALMGVLNITPDSFSDGGQLLAGGRPKRDAVLQRAERMIAEGAQILDVGGESTRPGADPVGIDEELSRVGPVLEWLADLDVIVSLDTRHGAVARAGLGLGCHLINDVSAGADAETLNAVAEHRAAICLMHMRGQPRDMQRAPQYNDVVEEVGQFLLQRAEAAQRAGIDDIVLDPGIGFGKTLAHNLDLLRAGADFCNRQRQRQYPLLVGVSRKSMVGKLTGREVGDRLAGSVTAAVFAASRGANILRVHDVAATADALAVWQALNGPHKDLS